MDNHKFVPMYVNCPNWTVANEANNLCAFTVNNHQTYCGGVVGHKWHIDGPDCGSCQDRGIVWSTPTCESGPSCEECQVTFPCSDCTVGEHMREFL